MRHRRNGRQLSRNWSERRALLESLVGSLLRYQAIQTTLAKAKSAQRLADRIITLGKTDTLHARRQAFAYLQDHALTAKLFKEISPRFKKRSGGYTRILRLQTRKGDGATMALLELTEKDIKVKETKKAKGRKEEKAEKKKAPEAPKADKAEAVDPSKPHAHPEEKPMHKSEHGPEKPKKGFFRDLGKFFKNKGGGS